jgi:hypothetical protein
MSRWQSAVRRQRAPHMEKGRAKSRRVELVEIATN